MGSINLKHTGSGSDIALSSDGTSLLLNGTAIGGGGADLYDANESSPTAQPSATGTNSIAIGDSAISTGTNSVALGKSLAGGGSSFAAQISNNTSSYGASSNNTIAIGYQAKATFGYGGAIGYKAVSTHSTAVAIGRDATTTAHNQVAVGGLLKPVRISGQYTLPTSDGTNGQVMTTDGNGVSSWATPSSGGGSGSGITTGKAIAMAMVFG
jgi:hypothetical protein